MNVFLRQDVAENYDNYYKTDSGKKVDEIEKEIISEFLNVIPKEELLDLGCGTGHWTEYFLSEGFKVKGVDISEPMLNIARGKNLNAKFLLGDSENLPFENESYQIVASITMLEFVENQNNAIQEIYRILKKDGWLIIGCLNANSILGKNKEKDEVFKNAIFFNLNDIKSKFKQFELKQIKSGVYLNADFSIMDNTKNNSNTEPVFFGALFKKI